MALVFRHLLVVACLKGFIVFHSIDQDIMQSTGVALGHECMFRLKGSGLINRRIQIGES